MTARHVVGGVLLGMGAVFQPKVDPTEHWSQSPRIMLVLDEVADDVGSSSLILDMSLLTPAPRPPVLRRRRTHRWWPRRRAVR